MIRLEHLMKRYGDRNILDDFSLSIADGEKLALMGESGRGKTTLLRIIAGLEEVEYGVIDGFSRKDVSYVFQEPRLFDSLSVIKNLTVVSELPYKEAERKAKDFLLRVGLSDDEQKRPSELSGGMKQRLALARAFMVDRSILLLDEPFSALDHHTKETMIEFVKECTKEKTVILVTHDKSDALALCQKIKYLP